MLPYAAPKGKNTIESTNNNIQQIIVNNVKLKLHIQVENLVLSFN